MVYDTFNYIFMVEVLTVGCLLDIAQVQSLLDENILSQPGEFLYSAVDSLRPGELYILGTNPGEVRVPSKYPTVGEQLLHLPEKDFNHYTKSGWALDGAQRINPRTSPLARKLETLINSLSRGYSLEEVCASNLIFIRTKNLSNMSINEFNYYASQCWKAHRLIINIVQPKALLVFGNSSNKSAFSFLKKELPAIVSGSFPSGHGKTQVHWFQTQLDNRKLLVFGLPHLSRFSIKPDAIASIVKKLADCP